MDNRDPYPRRILHDVGIGFGMGVVGGTIWYGVKGWRNSPRGERWIGMSHAVKSRAPVLGGNFGVWGGLFSSFDCTLAALRHKEDPWNSIISGAATGGVPAARAGRKAMAKNAIIGGVLLPVLGALPDADLEHGARQRHVDPSGQAPPPSRGAARSRRS